jgi:hypothetical protein
MIRKYLLILSLIYLLSIQLTFSNSQRMKFLEENEIKASISYDPSNDKYTVLRGVYDETLPAYLTYKDSLLTTGWDYLTISTYLGDDKRYSDEVKAYAMGYLEGQITSERIWNHYENCRHNFFNNTNGVMPENIREYLTENRKWVHSMSICRKDLDPFWHQAFLLMKQYEGLIEGYNSLAEPSKQITVEEALVMNSHDIDELNYYKTHSRRPQFHKMSPVQIEEHVDLHNHCSGLIKVNADFTDLWFGHETWTSFASMTRIFKEYRFKSNLRTEKALTIAMSSYPGSINSIDDFYITDRDLYVTETTNTVFNTTLYDLLDPHNSLLTWHRTMIANRLSDNGKDWTNYFSKYNSGTYNNQMQVLDLKLIDTQEKTIKDNALWIIEQIPGYTEAADVTHVLRYGYWPSYNTAYFRNVRRIAGYDDILEKNPSLRDVLDYHTCARANIFRRDHSKVNDMQSYKKLMRYNDYKNDVFSKNNPTYAIASRKDLDEKTPDCRGATDAKVASIKDIKGRLNKKITIVSGPTAEQQIPFDTVESKCVNFYEGKYVFHGLPKVFNYDWIEYETTLFTQ